LLIWCLPARIFFVDLVLLSISVLQSSEELLVSVVLYSC